MSLLQKSYHCCESLAILYVDFTRLIYLKLVPPRSEAEFTNVSRCKKNTDVTQMDTVCAYQFITNWNTRPGCEGNRLSARARRNHEHSRFETFSKGDCSARVLTKSTISVALVCGRSRPSSFVRFRCFSISAPSMSRIFPMPCFCSVIGMESVATSIREAILENSEPCTSAIIPLAQGCTTYRLLPAALRLLLWITVTSEFQVIFIFLICFCSAFTHWALPASRRLFGRLSVIKYSHTVECECTA